jgi:hypothetical protein
VSFAARRGGEKAAREEMKEAEGRKRRNIVIKRVLEYLGVPSYQRYAGLLSVEWSRRLHYRSGVDDRQSGTLAKLALSDALAKYDQKLLERIDTAVDAVELCVVAREHRRDVVRLLAVAALAASDASESERIALLTKVVQETKDPVRRAAAGCLFRIGTQMACTAILDGGPFNSGLERAVLWKMRDAPSIEYAPVLTRYLQRNCAYYKHLWLAVEALAEIREPAFPFIRALLKASSINKVSTSTSFSGRVGWCNSTRRGMGRG